MAGGHTAEWHCIATVLGREAVPRPLFLWHSNDQPGRSTASQVGQAVPDVLNP